MKAAIKNKDSKYSTLSLIDSSTAAYIRSSIVEYHTDNIRSRNLMNLFTLLDENNVIATLEAENKKQVIDTLVDTLKSRVSRPVLEDIREGVFERESVMSTGVGKGLAIPHCKSKSVEDNYAAFARLKTPLDFDSIDGEPVSIIFLLVGPDSRHSHHIKLLSRISRLMNSASFRDKIMAADTRDAILDAFKEEEEKYFVV